MLELRKVGIQISARKILNDVSFIVKPNEVIGIIGPNGSGKTTLFNIISGFLSTDLGEIEFNGRSITALSTHKRARLGIGRTFQDTGIFREMTALENIIVACEVGLPLRKQIFPWYSGRKDLFAKAFESLEEVGLGSYSKTRAGNLSGGQLRLLEIARLIATNAKLVLLDEPTAGVSPKMKEELEEMLLKLRAREVTILIIEHDINFIDKLCSKILVFDQGELVLTGAPDDVRQDSRLQTIYFGKGGNR